MKIAIVTPHIPNTRQRFIEQRNKLMEQQTRQADIDIIVDMPYNGTMDLPDRYRIGFEIAFSQGANLALAIEDDDYYAPDYIERMVSEWGLQGMPDMIGIDKTTYYHIGQKAYKTMEHPNRASMFCTGITERVMHFDFGKSVWLDILLWGLPVKKAMCKEAPIALGIKHGEGICGGSGHKATYQYEHKDYEGKYLKRITKEDYEFYATY
jgi:hypothetical protein